MSHVNASTKTLSPRPKELPFRIWVMSASFRQISFFNRKEVQVRLNATGWGQPKPAVERGDMVVQSDGHWFNTAGIVTEVFDIDPMTMEVHVLLWNAHPILLPDDDMEQMFVPAYTPAEPWPVNLVATCAEEECEGTWREVAPEEAKAFRDELHEALGRELQETFWEPEEDQVMFSRIIRAAHLLRVEALEG